MLDVIVIGAGAAGLAAAQSLVSAGRTAVVLEARHRIGGRVWTAHPWNDDLEVEWGAEFVQDCDAADDFWPRRVWPRTDAFPDRGAEYRYRFDGRGIGKDQYRGRMKRAMLGAEAIVGRNVHGSVGDTITTWCRPERDVAIREVEGEFAVAPGDLSARSVVLDAERWGRYRGDYRLAAPYASIIEALAAPVEIHLGDPVLEVVWGTSPVRAITRAGCAYTAKSVIVTLPLGILKAGAVAFTPSLSEPKRQAVGKLGVGSVVKVAVRARPFRRRLEYASCDGPEPPRVSWRAHYVSVASSAGAAW